MLTIPQQAGDDGRLFGSVTTQDIADAIREARGIKIDRRKIHLDEPIRNIGTYMVVVEIADDVTATVKTMVVALAALSDPRSFCGCQRQPNGSGAAAANVARRPERADAGRPLRWRAAGERRSLVAGHA